MMMSNNSGDMIHPIFTDSLSPSVGEIFLLETKSADLDNVIYQESINSPNKLMMIEVEFILLIPVSCRCSVILKLFNVPRYKYDLLVPK